MQFTGNFEEYFAMHTEKLVAFILMPRGQYKENLIRCYEKGKLVEEEKVILSKNIFIYYLLWYFYQLLFLLRYFHREEKVFLISFFPNSFFGIGLLKIIRNIEPVFWIADYFPPVSLFLRFYEKVKKYYNDKIKYVCYLSDIINSKYNKEIINSSYKKTIMWGIFPKKVTRKDVGKSDLTLLFVGVIRKSQGLEFLFEFLRTHNNYKVKIIGVGSEELYEEYKKVIRDYKIESQVYFPNRFFSDSELEEISKTCQIGVAFYDIDETSATYFTDPGKIKAYAQLGLPIIMSDTSAIAPYVKKFRCGEVISKNKLELEKAIVEVKENYEKYKKGLIEFNKHFYYNAYYRKSFKFLENI